MEKRQIARVELSLDNWALGEVLTLISTNFVDVPIYATNYQILT